MVRLQRAFCFFFSARLGTSHTHKSKSEMHVLVAQVHFPACSAAGGGWTDYNAFHEAEPAVDEKWVLQAFIWSHERLHWPAILDDENLEPDGPLSSSRL